MSGAMKSLFGGSEQKSQTTDSTPKDLKALRKPFSQTAQGLLGFNPGADVLAGVPQYQGDFTAPMTGNEQTLLQRLMGAGQGSQGLIDSTISGDYLQQGNPFLQAYIEAAQRQTASTLQDTLGRTLPGQFAQAGQSVQPGASSPFDMAAARAYEGGANALSDIATEIGFGAYESERGRQQEAIQFDQAQVQSTIQNLQAQALPRMIEQFGLDRGLEEFRTRMQTLLQTLATISGSPIAVQGQKSSGSSQGGIVPALFPGGATASGSVFS